MEEIETATARVHVVDDDASARDSLCWLLGTAGLPVRPHKSAEAFLADWRPDWRGCITMDVRMPGMDGLALLEALGAHCNTLPVVILTGHADVPMAIRAMKSGAFDFLEKPYRDDELLASIHRALAQHANRVLEADRIAGQRATLASLTPREREVMLLIVDGMTNRAIGDRLGISERTVEVHRARVMTKSGAGSLPELIRLWLATT